MPKMGFTTIEMITHTINSTIFNEIINVSKKGVWEPFF